MKQSTIAKLANAAKQPVRDFPGDPAAYDWPYDQPENLAMPLYDPIIGSADDDDHVEEDLFTDADIDAATNPAMPLYEPLDGTTFGDMLFQPARADKLIESTESIESMKSTTRQQGALEPAAALQRIMQGPMWDPRDHQGPQPLTSDALDQARIHVLATAASSMQRAAVQRAYGEGPMWEDVSQQAQQNMVRMAHRCLQRTYQSRPL